MNFSNSIGTRLGALLLAFAAMPVSAQLPSMLDPTVTQVAAGAYHTCALTTAGGVKCWGNNNYGQLGNTINLHSSNPNAAPLDVTGLTSGVVAIASGAFHTCALTTLGGVKCWGLNAYGQLGNSINAGMLYSPNATPLDVMGLTTGVAAIAAGLNHTCALTTAGGMKCWGYNFDGELGNSTNVGTSTANAVPLDVTSLTGGAMAIAIGDFHTCALTTTGGVKCWGYNNHGQLGNSTNASTSNANATPLDVTNLASGVTAIAAGVYHTCALTAAGGMKCWGYNGDGELGNGTNAGTSEANPTPLDVMDLSSGVTAIAADALQTCALTTAGGVKCWGNNFYGQLGNSSNTGTNNVNATPLDVTGLASGIAAITAGLYHTCALSMTGGMKCWGDNNNGQLGNSTDVGLNTANPTPLDVTSLTGRVTAIAAGEFHTCALSSAGGVLCWGSNSNGQLGSGTFDSHLPVAVVVDSTYAPISGIAAIAAGEIHTCALATGGTVKCWGDNHSGQLGNPVLNSSSFPIDVVDATTTPISGVAAIATGDYHTCALTTAGTVKCWGRNSNGQLGNNMVGGLLLDVVDSTNTPIGGVAAIAADGDHTCALTIEGEVMCWGSNSNGQLGNNTTMDSPVAVVVTGLTSRVAAIAAGAVHTCALTTAGSMKCWGLNVFGQLGDNTTTDSSVPVDVTGLTSGVAAILARKGQSCALTMASAMKCWGYNVFGQLGNNTTTDSSVPVDVSGLTNGVATIAAGDFHTCALTTTGGLKCWGYNVFGQLGNDTTIDSHVPISILTGQSIAFAPGSVFSGQPLPIMLGSSLPLGATVTGGGTPVFDSWTPDTCTVSGMTLTATAKGLCGVRVSQPGGADEANGTLAAAPQQLRLLQIVKSGFVSLTPARILDTRIGRTTSDGLYAGGGAVTAHGELDMSVLGRGGVAASGVDAVVLNVTVTDPTNAAFVTVWPTGATRPTSSNLNFAPGDSVSNLVIVKLGTEGQVSLFNSAGSTDLIADVVGYFVSGSDLTSFSPTRLLDTRPGRTTDDGLFEGAGALGAHLQLDLTISNRGGVPSTGAGAVIMNVTATDPTATGFITAWPTDSLRPTASTLNFVHGQTIPNLVISKLSSIGQVSLFNSAGTTDLIADVTGWFPSNGDLTSLDPARLLDTRAGRTTVDGQDENIGALVAHASFDLLVSGRGGVPASGVGAVVLNVTVTDPAAAGFLVAWPADATRPQASNLNFASAQTIANLVIAKLSADGKVSLFSNADTDAIVDVVGWFQSP